MSGRTIVGHITHADFGFGRMVATMGLLLTFSDGHAGFDVFEGNLARIAAVLAEADVVVISQLVGRKARAEFDGNDRLVGWRLD